MPSAGQEGAKSKTVWVMVEPVQIGFTSALLKQHLEQIINKGRQELSKHIAKTMKQDATPHGKMVSHTTSESRLKFKMRVTKIEAELMVAVSGLVGAEFLAIGPHPIYRYQVGQIMHQIVQGVEPDEAVCNVQGRSLRSLSIKAKEKPKGREAEWPPLGEASGYDAGAAGASKPAARDPNKSCWASDPRILAAGESATLLYETGALENEDDAEEIFATQGAIIDDLLAEQLRRRKARSARKKDPVARLKGGGNEYECNESYEITQDKEKFDKWKKLIMETSAHIGSWDLIATEALNLLENEGIPIEVELQLSRLLDVCHTEKRKEREGYVPQWEELTRLLAKRASGRYLVGWIESFCTDPGGGKSPPSDVVGQAFSGPTSVDKSTALQRRRIN